MNNNFDMNNNFEQYSYLGAPPAAGNQLPPKKRAAIIAVRRAPLFPEISGAHSEQI